MKFKKIYFSLTVLLICLGLINFTFNYSISNFSLLSKDIKNNSKEEGKSKENIKLNNDNKNNSNSNSNSNSNEKNQINNKKDLLPKTKTVNTTSSSNAEISDKDSAITNKVLNKRTTAKSKTSTKQATYNFKTFDQSANAILVISTNSAMITSIRVNTDKVDLSKTLNLANPYLTSVEFKIAENDYLYIDATNTNSNQRGMYGHLLFYTGDGSLVYFPTGKNWECMSQSSSNDDLFEEAYVSPTLNRFSYLTMDKLPSTVPIWYKSDKSEDKVTCRVKITYKNASKGMLNVGCDNVISAINVNNKSISLSYIKTYTSYDQFIDIPDLKPEDELEICGRNVGNGSSDKKDFLSNPGAIAASLNIVYPDMSVNNYTTNSNWTCNGQQPMVLGDNSFTNPWGDLRRLGSGQMIWSPDFNFLTCCKFKIPKNDKDNLENRKFTALLKLSSDNPNINVRVNDTLAYSITKDTYLFRNTYYIPLSIKPGDKLRIGGIKGDVRPTKFLATITSEYSKASTFTNKDWSCNNASAVETGVASTNFFGQSEGAKEIKFDYNNVKIDNECVCETEYQDKKNLRATFNVVIDDYVDSVRVGATLLPAFRSNGNSVERFYRFDYNPGEELEVCGTNAGSYSTSNPGFIVGNVKYYNINGEYKTIMTNGKWQCRPQNSDSYYTPAYVNQILGGINILNGSGNNIRYKSIDEEAYLMWYSDLNSTRICCKIVLPSEASDALLFSIVKEDELVNNGMTGLLVGVADKLLSIKVNDVEIDQNIKDGFAERLANAVNMPGLKVNDKVSISAQKSANFDNDSIIVAKVFYTKDGNIVNVGTDKDWICNNGRPTTFKNTLIDSDNLKDTKGLWVDYEAPATKVVCVITLK